MLVTTLKGELLSVPVLPVIESIVTVGAVVSLVTVTFSLAPVLVAASVTHTRSVLAPSLRFPEVIALVTVLGEVE